MRIGMMTDLDKPYISRMTHHISLTKGYLKKAGHGVFIFTLGNIDHADFEQGVERSTGLPPIGTGHTLGFLCNRRSKVLFQTMVQVHVHHLLVTGQLEKLRT
jgi:hypothetical protein